MKSGRLFDYRAICDLLKIPPDYITGMGIEVEGQHGVGAYAVMTVTLRRLLTEEEWQTIATLTEQS